MQKILCFFVAMLGALSATAQHQKLNISQQYPYIYYYTVSDREAIRFLDYEKYYFNLASFLLTHQPSDSVPANDYKSKIPKTGNYLVVSVLENRVEAAFLSQTSLDIQLLDSPFGYQVSVKKPGGEAVSDAIVKLKNHRLKYEPGKQTYEWLKTNQQGFLMIKTDSHTVIRNIERREDISGMRRFLSALSNLSIVRYGWMPLYSPRFGYNSKGTNNIEGFIILNKPKYLPDDTVKFKAYFFHPSGKPYQHPLFTAEISDKDKSYFSDTMKMVGPGAYTGSLILKDTLTADRSYWINIYKKNGDRLRQEIDFRVEDYQLKEFRYEVRKTIPDEEAYLYGDTVKFYLDGRDANGFPMMDGSVEISMSTKSISKVFSPDIYVPLFPFQQTVALDPQGDFLFAVPDSIWPAANMNIEAKFHFFNTNGETYDTTLQLKITRSPAYIDIEDETTSLKVTYKTEGVVSQDPKAINMIRYYEGGQSDTSIITIPASIPIDHACSYYIFSDGFVSNYFAFQEKLHQVQPQLLVTNDTASIHIQNPRNIPLYWEIYRNKKLYKSGYSPSCSLKEKNRKNTAWSVYAYFEWIGKNQKVHSWGWDDPDRLQVKLEVPENIYPGQETEIFVTVKDAKGKPVAADLTAFSYNHQFRMSPKVALPRKFPKIHLPVNYNTYSQEPVLEKSFAYLNRALYNQIIPDSLEYYQLMFPENGQKHLYKSIDDSLAQFSVHVFNNGKEETPVMIFVEGKLRFFSGWLNNDAYSIRYKPGTYEIGVRTASHAFVMKDVALLPGQKLILSVDLACDTQIQVIPLIDNTFGTFYSTLINNSSFKLWGRYNSLHQMNFSYIKAKERLYKINNEEQTIYGPFIPREKLYFLDAYGDILDSLLFEPGYEYSFDNDRIKMRAVEFINPLSKRSTYNRYRIGQRFGEIMPSNPFLSKKASNTFPTSRNAYRTQEGNGKLYPAIPTDNTFSFIFLANDSIKNNYWALPANTTTIENIFPGNYTVFLLNKEKTHYLKKSILIKENYATWIQWENKEYFPADLLFPDLIPAPVKEPKDSANHTSNNVLQEQSFFNDRMYIGNEKLYGTVKEANTNEPIPFASVKLKINQDIIAGTMTDIDGKFSFNGIQQDQYTLIVSSLGYTTVQYLSITPQKSEVKITLRPDTKNLAAVEIIGNETSLYREEILRFPNSTAASVRYGSAGLEQVAFIDGQYIIPGVFSVNEEMAGFLGGVPAEYGDDADLLSLIELGNRLMETPTTSTNIRTNFLDYGYWQPALRTDKSGKTSFKVTFPDNITQWDSYIYAIDDKGKSGIGTGFSRAFKPLAATLSTPRFLVEGDSTYFIGKILNYQKNASQVSVSANINTQNAFKTDTNILQSGIWKLPVMATGDQLSYTFQLATAHGYSDGEERTIPVFAKGVTEAAGNITVLEKDTVFALSFPDSVHQVSIYASNGIAGMLENEALALLDYPYACNEQAASKLKGVLALLTIRGENAENFKYRKTVSELIGQLIKSQRYNGSWGWWPGSDYNAKITLYVTEVLLDAEKKGFKVSNIYSSLQFLLKNEASFSQEDRFHIAGLLSEKKLEIDRDYLLNSFVYDSVDLHTKLRYWEYLQQTGNPISIDAILALGTYTYMGNLHFGNSSSIWYNNANINTSLAYRIIRNIDSLNPALKKIRNYWLMEKGDLRNVNTAEKSAILDALGRDQPAIFKPGKTEITIQGKTYHEFPVFIEKNNALNQAEIRYKGNEPLYFSVFHEFFNPQPERKSDTIAVNVSFTTKDTIRDTLIFATIAKMNVSIELKNKVTYFMVEVPIPAGCSYGKEGHKLPYETHREYLKNKVAIFFETLPAGKHNLTINLEPRFSGQYNLNPATASLMYYPTIYGREAMKKVVIR